MRKNQNTEEVRQTIERLIENGSQYNVDELDRIYHDDLTIVKIDEVGEVTAIDKAENMALFREKRDSGAEPLSTEAEFNYASGGSDTGHVIVTRKMQLQSRLEKSVFSIHLVQEDGRWQVIQETAFVQPISADEASK
ncbi:nuclear transport factor 2 family protein [Haladaptatus sp. DYF46]|uniref:nuclear transport factor 2 family protein n=1 Tax=Haladaptatus sp. DYF46 TaxID=2886041 RepID=UPI001E3496E3|nr:nuclear transport factor 2 family protein [Haladaptatus sp. DYF46]